MTQTTRRLLAAAAAGALLASVPLTAHAAEVGVDTSADAAIVHFGQESLLRVTGNDTLPADAVLEVVTPPRLGSAEVRGQFIAYSPTTAYAQAFDQFTYRACVGEVCDTAVVGLLLAGDVDGAEVAHTAAGNVAVAANFAAGTADTWTMDGAIPTFEDEPLAVDVLSASYPDASARKGKLTIVNGPDRGHAAVWVNGDGQPRLRYTPDFGADDHYTTTVDFQWCVNANFDGDASHVTCETATATLMANRFDPDTAWNTNYGLLSGTEFGPAGDRLIEWNVGAGALAPAQMAGAGATADQATVRVLAGPRDGEVSVAADGSLRYVPTRAGFYTDALVYQFVDSDGVTQTRAAQVGVRGDNFTSGPDVVALPDTITVEVGHTATVPALDNDRYNGSAALSVVTEPTLGTATADRTKLTYTAGSQAGDDTLTYRLCADKAVCADAAVKVKVVPAKPQPPTDPTPTPDPVTPTPTPTPPAPGPKPTGDPVRDGLPNTGGSLGLLALLGLGLTTGAGAVAAGVAARRRAA